MTLVAQQIAQREAELTALEDLKRQVAATESRPAELRQEIDALRRQEREQVEGAKARYLNALAPCAESQAAALALVSHLADAIEVALQQRVELEDAYRALVNLGVEPSERKPERVDVLQGRDRDVHGEFNRLRVALGARF
jgi:hypothetical protein